MKKIFKVIVLLITLSLVGIIGIQVSWFKNLLQVQEQRILYKVEVAALKVIQSINTQSAINPMFRLKRPGAGLLPETFSVLTPPTISQRYSRYEIEEKLQDAFEENGLKNIHFEYAIVNNNLGVYEMQSANFEKATADSLNYKRKIIPVTPENNSLMPGVTFDEFFIIILPNFQKQLWASVIWMVMLSVVFTLVIIAAFYVTVKTLINQRKLSIIKSDFINNMTHEFKTPLATISLAVDALKNEKVLSDPDKMGYFSGIIKEENVRMNKHVETILQAALMEKRELKLNRTPVHIHELITTVTDNFKLRLHEKNGQLELLLNAKNDVLAVDEVHFRNVISNLLDNAIKYSKEEEPVHIKIITHCTHKNFIVRVEDNGIGMNKETVKRVFEKFYRSHTGNIHNVKGFGLGMSYVKGVIDAHQGKIKVESVLGKGSRFTLEIPVTK